MSVTVPSGMADRPARPHPSDEALREQAIARIKRKRKFWEDLVLYLSVNGVLWVIWALADRSTDGWVPWPTWVSAIWGFLLAVDAIRAFSGWPLSGPISESEIERELGRRNPR